MTYSYASVVFLSVFSVSLSFVSPVRAEAPIASYIFPAGGQRGKTVDVRVGGLFLHGKCGFEMLGTGVEADKECKAVPTRWLEGPLLPLPESQQPEDYPKDLANQMRIAADAPLGARPWRLWTSQGATPSLKFVVGDLPEIVEDETSSQPTPVTLPVTANGRIFPRENIDIYTFDAKKGQTVCCEVTAARLGSPLDSRLEARDARGQRLAENDDHFGSDSFLRFTAPADGKYSVHIHDVQYRGGPAYVYRLTMTAGPYLERVYPLGGRRGSTVKLECAGSGLPATAEVALAGDAPHDLAYRLVLDGQTTNPFLLDVDDLPEHLETEPNDTPDKAMRIALPAMLNGRIDKPGDIDCWSVPFKKGEAVEFDLRGQRLGSPLHGVLTLCDEAGKELARAEADGPAADPLLRFTAPADGVYCLRVADRFRSRGGPAFAYRIRAALAPTADFRLTLATDAVTLPRGGQFPLRVTAERLGNFADAIAFDIDGLPAGVTASGTIPAKQTQGTITLKADATAKIQAIRLQVRGKAKIGDQEALRVAALATERGQPEIDTVLLGVALPTPFKIVATHDMRWAPRGSVHRRTYRLERTGYDGPLEVSLADRQARHLQGVVGPVATIPAGAKEFEYGVQLAPWMETGRTCRVCIMAVATVKDADGSEHVVSFSSTQVNEQIIVVVEPERLNLEASRASVVAEAGHAVEVPIRVARGKGLSGPVTVALHGPLPKGVSAESVTIAADKDRGSITLRFSANVRASLVLRATLMDNGQSVIAEANVDVVPPVPGRQP